MAEPLVDETSLGGPQDNRKLSSPGRPLSGVCNGGERGSGLSSPASSPRTPDSSHNYSIDASGSTYALQVALRNMKERYHKLQKKMALIEDDNSRLITGKSELFGEIGKLQENSIKLREKNLQLNHEIHSKHQECCSLKERFSSLSQENMSLARQLARAAHDNRRLTKQVSTLSDENQRLKEKLALIATQVRALPGGGVAVAGVAELAQLTSHRTKIIPSSDDLESFEDLTRFHPAVDDYDQVSEGMDAMASDWGDDEENEDEDGKIALSLQSATRRMKQLLSSLQEQHQGLLLLSPLIHSVCVPPYSQNHTGTLGQRDRALSTLTVTPPSAKLQGGGAGGQEEVEEEDGVCHSRLATCGSVINSTFTSAGGMHVSPLTDDSGGDNVHIGGVGEERPQSPFDWRQVQVSDDEGGGREGGGSGIGNSSDPTRPTPAQ